MSSVADPDPLLHTVESGGVVASLRATVATSESFVLRTSLAGQWDRYSDTPAGSTEPWFQDFVEGTLSGGRAIWTDEDRGRANVTVQGRWPCPGIP